MITATNWSDIDPDDSASLAGTLSSTSTVPGPGAITGKLLKAIGERSLDLVVSIIVRNRLAAIERILERSPHVLRNPAGDKEWERVLGVYKDLYTICRESGSEYYPLSLQRAAANLIRKITFITRPTPEMFIDAAPTNEKWEALFVLVERRQELSFRSPLVTSGPPKRDIRSLQSTGSEHPDLPTEINSTKAEVDVNLVSHSNKPSAGKARNRRLAILRDRILKPSTTRVLPRPTEVSEIPPNDPTRKVLILGAGRAGKSTLVRQLREYLYRSLSQDGTHYGDLVIRNLWDSMKDMLSTMDESDVSLAARDSFKLVMNNKHFVDYPTGDCVECISMGTAIAILRQEPAVRRCAQDQQMRPELYFDSAKYLFDSSLRISHPDYQPTLDDIMHTFVPTIGLNEYRFNIAGHPWLVIDPGGWRSERKKWILGFHNATAVIFVVALSDYNKTLFEDPETNSMNESLILFESIVNSKWFTRSLIILLFNKIDLFAEKLGNLPLKDYFPDYDGEDFSDACEYFESRFLSLVNDKQRPLAVKYGCALKTEMTHGNFQSIFGKVNRHHEEKMGALRDLYMNC